MRGLFITGPNGQGPQLTTATTGDQLTLAGPRLQLKPRVIAIGRAGARALHGHALEHPQNIPTAASFQIGEQTIASIQLPPLNSGTSATPHPNWTLVSQPFDTSGTHCGGQSCDNQDLVFWVVVWIQNADGTLGSELSEHGLATIPAAGEDFLAVANREQTYSNNLGFYNQYFGHFLSERG